MILLHHPEVELSRLLLAALPEGCDVIEGPGGYAVSAFPSVVVDVPAYAEDRPVFGANGEFLGMEPETVPAHQELLRLPASWEAVASFMASAEERARLRPAA
jgi:hypothetical protein